MNLHDRIDHEIKCFYVKHREIPTLIRLSRKYLEQLKHEMNGVIGINLTDGILEYRGIEVIEDINDDDVIKCYID